MSILTSIEQGLHFKPGTRAGQIEERLRNGQRYARWQRNLHRQGSGASSRPSGWEVFVQCVAGSTLAALFLLIAVVLMGFSEVAKSEHSGPECRDQFTSDTRYVRHCNFHDGRGWIETKKDTK